MASTLDVRSPMTIPEPVLLDDPVTKLYADTTRNDVAANTRTAAYGAVLSDQGKVVEMNSASALNFNVPTNAVVAFPIGTSMYVCRLGTGAVTITASTGVTLNGVGVASNSLTMGAQYSTVWLRKRATDSWILVAL